ncbi:galectin-8-like isoform X2 [Macrosteles quadrilineatus]|uniref:galectin-8-like isoform X2 n=1 Tax=Macrosteles quadrilineatus TaxID=74068 RepID=UPI0023E08F99|nr:galectin-8-like isoform X2 [Macrosteles quadrilineatus]
MDMAIQPQKTRGYQMPLKPGVWLKRRIVKVTYPGEGKGPIEDGHGSFLDTDEDNLRGSFHLLGPLNSNINMLKALAPGQTKMSQIQTKPVEGMQTDVGDHMLEICRVVERTHVIYKLTSQLYEQSSIIVEGVVNDDALWFQVNFNKLTDIKAVDGPLGSSFTVWFYNNTTEHSTTMINGTSTNKEISDAEKFPFRQGQPFYLEFYITEAGFMVAVGGQHYRLLKHREPLSDIAKFEIHGHLTSTNVHFQNTSKYPSPLIQTKPVEGGQTDVGHPMLEIYKVFEMTYVVYKLKSQLDEQSSIIVEGVVNDNANRFEVEFLIGNEGEDYWFPVAFQFVSNVKKEYTYKSNFLEKRGDKERSVAEKFPFRRGQPFYLEFYITEAEFKVAVDGQHYDSYKHRVPFKDITRIRILGHITLNDVHFQNTSKYPSPMIQKTPGSVRGDP